LPIGYNHPDLTIATTSPEYIRALANRAHNAFHPNINWPRLVRETLLPIAPTGLTDVLTTCGCGSSANESAYKYSFLNYMKNAKGRTPSESEL